MVAAKKEIRLRLRGSGKPGLSVLPAGYSQLWDTENSLLETIAYQSPRAPAGRALQPELTLSSSLPGVSIGRSPSTK